MSTAGPPRAASKQSVIGTLKRMFVRVFEPVIKSDTRFANMRLRYAVENFSIQMKHSVDRFGFAPEVAGSPITGRQLSDLFAAATRLADALPEKDREFKFAIIVGREVTRHLPEGAAPDELYAAIDGHAKKPAGDNSQFVKKLSRAASMGVYANKFLENDLRKTLRNAAPNITDSMIAAFLKCHYLKTAKSPYRLRWHQCREQHHFAFHHCRELWRHFAMDDIAFAFKAAQVREPAAFALLGLGSPFGPPDTARHQRDI